MLSVGTSDSDEDDLAPFSPLYRFCMKVNGSGLSDLDSARESFVRNGSDPTDPFVAIGGSCQDFKAVGIGASSLDMGRIPLFCMSSPRL